MSTATTTTATTRSPSTVAVVAQVAAREFTVRVVNKAFLVSTAVLLVIIVGGLAGFAAFGGSDDGTKSVRVGVVGGSSELSPALTAAGEALGQPVEVTALGSAAQARTEVGNGTVEAALVADPAGSYTVVTETSLGDTLAPVLTAGVRQAAQDAALARQGVDPSTVTAAVARATLSVDALDPPDAAQGQRTVIAYVAVLLLFFSVFVWGLYVAMGVVEEKASRVVELLLSTVTPLQLLVGKVVGIGAVGLAQLLVFGGVGLATAMATGLLTIGATAVALFVSVLVWYLLGYAFFALLYAAAGSLVSRQEDVNSVATPLSTLGFAAYFVAQFALTSPENTVAAVLAWVPPFSAYLMPLRIAQGQASAVQVVATILLMLAACAVAAVLAARIYRRSVLNTGAKQSWRQALARA